MNQLIEEVKNFIYTKYNKKIITAVGLGTDEDIKSFLIDTRSDPRDPFKIINEYITEQYQAILIDEILNNSED